MGLRPAQTLILAQSYKLLFVWPKLQFWPNLINCSSNLAQTSILAQSYKLLVESGPNFNTGPILQTALKNWPNLQSWPNLTKTALKLFKLFKLLFNCINCSNNQTLKQTYATYRDKRTNQSDHDKGLGLNNPRPNYI